MSEAEAQENLENRLAGEISKNRFKTFARERFQDYIPPEPKILDFIKESARLSSLNLPANYSEQFINVNLAPVYWICEAKTLKETEEWLKLSGKLKKIQLDALKQIKEFYLKWLNQKAAQDKKYFALSILKLYEREANDYNIINNFMYASLFAFESSVKDIDKALGIINKTKQSILSFDMDENLKQELLYLANLYHGFIFMEDNQIEEAGEAFNEAMASKPFGITAKFYRALIDQHLGSSLNAVSLLKDIYDYDAMRLRFAIQNGSLALYSYFLHSALTYNVVTEMGFSDLLNEIEDFINFSKSEQRLSLEKIDEVITRLKIMNLEEYVDEKAEKIIQFLEKFYETYEHNKNVFVTISGNFIIDKFNELIQQVISNYKEKNYGEISEKVKLYDSWIMENTDAIGNLQRDWEAAKDKYAAAYEEYSRDIEKKMNDLIAEAQFKNDNIQLNEKLNPKVAFSNAMVYGMILSFLVFIFGGFSGCYGNSFRGFTDFGMIFSSVLLTGFKWGMVTFVISIVFSFIISGFTSLERSNEKQRLASKLINLKKKKERDLTSLKKQYDDKLKDVDEYYKEKIKNHDEKRSQSLKEKEDHFNQLKDEVDGKLNEKVKEINTSLADFR